MASPRVGPDSNATAGHDITAFPRNAGAMMLRAGWLMKFQRQPSIILRYRELDRAGGDTLRMAAMGKRTC